MVCWALKILNLRLEKSLTENEVIYYCKNNFNSLNLDNLDNDHLQSEYPILVFDSKTSTELSIDPLNHAPSLSLRSNKLSQTIIQDNLAKST